MANLFFLLPAVLGLLIPQPALAAVSSNYMLSGDTLQTDERLSYGDYNFIMQGDCNLVLYNGWQSNTANNGKDCKLTLNNNGQLIIKSGTGSTVWTSSAASGSGNYAAVLHPEGKVVVYGPNVWQTRSVNKGARLGNTPLTPNALFSGQILYSDGRLTARNYQLVMQGDCNLVLYGGGGWQSNTHGNGKYCFLRLDHKGELAIKDDGYSTVWRSGRTSKEGDYVFILQEDGRAVVYGPAIWSTKQNNIAMVTGINESK